MGRGLALVHLLVLALVDVLGGSLGVQHAEEVVLDASVADLRTQLPV